VNLKDEIKEAYLSDIINKSIIYQDIGREVPSSFKFKANLLIVLLILKIIVSFFFRKRKRNSIIGIEWSKIHEDRIKDLESLPMILHYYSRKINLQQIMIFKGFDISLFYQLYKEIVPHDFPFKAISNDYNYDSKGYRILFLIDYVLFLNVLKEREEVFIAGLNDRLSIIISKICHRRHISLNMLQHGLLARREGLNQVAVSRYYYLYNFSLPCLKYAVKPSFSGLELIELKKKSNRKFSASFNINRNKNIAYATMPAFQESNFAIIDMLLDLNKDYSFNILIYPHPLENIDTYHTKYKKEKNLFFSSERHQNLELLISQCSTLGVEYFYQGINSVFVNLHDFKVDIAEAEEFTVYNSINALKGNLLAIFKEKSRN